MISKGELEQFFSEQSKYKDVKKWNNEKPVIFIQQYIYCLVTYSKNMYIR